MTLLPVFLIPLACALSYWLGVRLGQRREVIDLPPPGGDLALYRTVKARLDEADRERDQALADARRSRNVSQIVGNVNRELTSENERLKERLCEAVETWGEWRDYALRVEGERDTGARRRSEMVSRLASIEEQLSVARAERDAAKRDLAERRERDASASTGTNWVWRARSVITSDTSDTHWTCSHCHARTPYGHLHNCTGTQVQTTGTTA